jgi:DNA modification methylase
MTVFILFGDCRDELKRLTDSVDLIMTSPPYADARAGHYDSVCPDDYPDWFTSFHNAFWHALKPTGNLIINIKGRVVDGVRHRYVWKTIEKLTDLGWYCIDDYIWHKKNSMPGYWPSRLRDSWEYCFHLAKTKKPYMNQKAVSGPAKESTIKRYKQLYPSDLTRNTSTSGSGFGKTHANWFNKTSVLPGNVLWTACESRLRYHPAVFPIELPQFFIKLFSPENGLVLDPFGGSGTTGIAATNLNRDCILIDNNKNYCQSAYRRLLEETPLTFNEIRFLMRNFIK